MESEIKKEESNPEEDNKRSIHNIENNNKKLKKEFRPGNESYCLRHPDKITDLYCTDCKEVICDLCHSFRHKDHKINPLNNFEEYNRLTNLQQQIEDAERKLDFLNTQSALAKQQIETAQLLKKKDKKLEETENDLYIQCMRFARVAHELESHVVIVNVRDLIIIGFI